MFACFVLRISQSFGLKSEIPKSVHVFFDGSVV